MTRPYVGIQLRLSTVSMDDVVEALDYLKREHDILEEHIIYLDRHGREVHAGHGRPFRTRTVRADLPPAILTIYRLLNAADVTIERAFSEQLSFDDVIPFSRPAPAPLFDRLAAPE